MMMHGLAKPKYTKRRPFEQAAVGLLQELHELNKTLLMNNLGFLFLT
jgi:hypothetical protein